jgi:hypothetical protein
MTVNELMIQVKIHPSPAELLCDLICTHGSIESISRGNDAYRQTIPIFPTDNYSSGITAVFNTIIGSTIRTRLKLSKFPLLLLTTMSFLLGSIDSNLDGIHAWGCVMLIYLNMDAK